MRYAGQVLTGVGGLGAGIAVGNYMNDDGLGHLPLHRQRMTQGDHAINNLQHFSQDGSNIDDVIEYEGIRQALMGNLITSTDVNRMLIEGKLRPGTENLLMDIHDAGSSDLMIDPRGLVQDMVRDGHMTEEYGRELIMNQQALRDELGINVPV